jgi:DNA-binding transcriptional ArsR family regulator
MSFEEDTYTTIFSALRHPIRRKILRMLEVAPATYTEIMNALGVETGLLNYHLESLSTLLAKNDEGMYHLSDFGEAAMSLTRRVEEPVSGQGALEASEWRRMTLRFITGLLIVCVAIALYLVANVEVQLVKEYETIDYGNSWYPPNGLYSLEIWTDHPGTLMNL